MVENHRVFADTVAKAFLSSHEVSFAAGLTDARAALAIASFGAVLVDYDLDDGKGDILVRELRSNGFAGAVVAISSHEEGNALLRAAGASATCAKSDFARIGSLLALGVEVAVYVEPRSTAGEDVAESYLRNGTAICVVADGAGGMGGGLRAAQQVMAAVGNLPGDAALLSQATWVALLSDVGTKLAHRNEGLTTAVVLACDGARLAGAGVGDTEVWSFDEGVTVITAGQARKPLLGEVGATPRGFSAELGGATVVIGSDGLFQYAPTDRLAERARSSEPVAVIARQLVDLARLPSGRLQDDASAIVLRAKR